MFTFSRCCQFFTLTAENKVLFVCVCVCTCVFARVCVLEAGTERENYFLAYI